MSDAHIDRLNDALKTLFDLAHLKLRLTVPTRIITRTTAMPCALTIGKMPGGELDIMIERASNQESFPPVKDFSVRFLISPDHSEQGEKLQSSIFVNGIPLTLIELEKADLRVAVNHLVDNIVAPIVGELRWRYEEKPLRSSLKAVAALQAISLDPLGLS